MIYFVVFLLWSFGLPPPLHFSLSHHAFLKPLALKNTLGTLVVFWPVVMAGQVTVPSGITSWPSLLEERNTLNTRISSRNGPRHGGCYPTWCQGQTFLGKLRCGASVARHCVSLSLCLYHVYFKFSTDFLLGQVTILSLLLIPLGPRKCWLELGLLPQSSVPRRSGMLRDKTDLPKLQH